MKHLKGAVPLVAIVAVAGLTACGDSDQSSTESTQADTAAHTESTAKQSPVTTVVVKNGEPVGGARELEYNEGEQVRFTVRSDVADEVHIHGYDLMKDVPAGGSVSFSFQADIEGIFEVELEEHREQIAELRVNP